MEFDRIYESMNGMLEEADPNYPSEFEEGMECWSLYESIFYARIRLSRQSMETKTAIIPI